MDSLLLEKYQIEDNERRINLSKVGCILSFVLVPAGLVIDHYIYTDKVYIFLIVRFISSLLLLALYILHFVNRIKKYAKQLGILLAFFTYLPLCYIIYATNGSASPYYAYLNLVILAFGVLLPWSLKETMFVSLSILITYILSCILYSLHSVGHIQFIFEDHIFYNNAFFILLTGIISSTSSYYNSIARFKDYLLRAELAQQKLKQEEINKSLESVNNELGISKIKLETINNDLIDTNSTLEITNIKLKEMDQLKSEFFSNIQHELRTPLTLILSPIEELLTKSHELPGKIHETLVVAQKNSLRLLKLVNESLDIVRLEEGKMNLTLLSIDINTFILGIVESIRYAAAKKRIKISTVRHLETIIIDGDPDRLDKVFINLLNNAIKFTPNNGSIEIDINSDDEFAIIKVIDSGIGIEEDQLPRIFKRFHQVDGSTTKIHQGVGIGLALTIDLVKSHNGTIKVNSKVNEGTTFTIQLPLRKDQPEVKSVEINEVRNDSDELFAAANKAASRYIQIDEDSVSIDLPQLGSGEHTVLVVDDEPDMRRYLANSLAEEYHVLQAASGTKGLELAIKEQPDIILLDWMLPEMDGLEVCNKVRANELTKDIKIILLTALAGDEPKIKALKAGADDFMNKPFSTIEVKTRIANLVHSVVLQKDLRNRYNELNTAHKKLQEAETQLVQSEKMSSLGTLAAGILHEVNNPLNFMITALEFAKREVDENSTDLIETLQDIDSGMKRIKNIVTDLNTFAYSDNDKRFEPIQIEECINIATTLSSSETKESGVKIYKNIEKTDKLCGSKTQLIHLFINLIVNASKAVKEKSEAKDAKIELTGKIINDKYILTVLDNGIGINPEKISKVFDPFFTTRDVGKGMGLGLSICHTIIKNHNGEIYVNSKLNEWTKFSIELPLE